jgi:hypothetical protein
MSLQIRTSLTGSIGRCLNRNGLLLALAYVFVGAAWQVLLYSAVVTAVGQSAAPSGASALPTVNLPLVASAGGAVVALVFALLYIPAEDQRFIAALRSSWNVTRGNWLRLFGLLAVVLVAITIVPGVLSALTSAVFTTPLGPALATLASGTLTLPFSLLLLGILAEAFTQLRTAQERSEPRTGASAA